MITRNSKVEPYCCEIRYLGYNQLPVYTHHFIKYTTIQIKAKLDILIGLLFYIEKVIQLVELKSIISGVHYKVYSFLLNRRFSELRYFNKFVTREYGLYEFRNIIKTWITFLSSNLAGLYLHEVSGVQLEKITRTNIKRLDKTVSDYEKHIEKLFVEQKKVGKYRLMRWIQKHTMGKGFTPSFIQINQAEFPIIKYEWDFSM